MRITPDKIASSTRNANLSSELELSDKIICKQGYVIAGKILNDKSTYNTLELPSGRQSRVCKNDIVVGVLGARNALRGYSGVVPDTLKAGDVIQVLNLGGVMGKFTSGNPAIGSPFNIEVLGSVLSFPDFTERIGHPAHVLDGTVKPQDSLGKTPPLVIVTGTSMQAGKTTSACEIVKQLTHQGLKINAAKLTGISLMRDMLEMKDVGAKRVVDFTDAGIVCTNPDNVVHVAKGIVTTLAKDEPDCIVLEFGDGIMGQYGVMQLLLDKELMSNVKAHILAANDQVGAWGAVKYLEGKCPAIDAITGPATDNTVGTSFVTTLGVQAANAMMQGELLGKIAARKLGLTIKVIPSTTNKGVAQ